MREAQTHWVKDGEVASSGALPDEVDKGSEELRHWDQYREDLNYYLHQASARRAFQWDLRKVDLVKSRGEWQKQIVYYEGQAAKRPRWLHRLLGWWHQIDRKRRLVALCGVISVLRDCGDQCRVPTKVERSGLVKSLGSLSDVRRGFQVLSCRLKVLLECGGGEAASPPAQESNASRNAQGNAEGASLLPGARGVHFDRSDLEAWCSGVSSSSPPKRLFRGLTEDQLLLIVSRYRQLRVLKQRLSDWDQKYGKRFHEWRRQLKGVDVPAKALSEGFAWYGEMREAFDAIGLPFGLRREVVLTDLREGDHVSEGQGSSLTDMMGFEFRWVSACQGHEHRELLGYLGGKQGWVRGERIFAASAKRPGGTYWEKTRLERIPRGRTRLALWRLGKKRLGRLDLWRVEGYGVGKAAARSRGEPLFVWRCDAKEEGQWRTLPRGWDAYFDRELTGFYERYYLRGLTGVTKLKRQLVAQWGLCWHTHLMGKVERSRMAYKAAQGDRGVSARRRLLSDLWEYFRGEQVAPVWGALRGAVGPELLGAEVSEALVYEDVERGLDLEAEEASKQELDEEGQARSWAVEVWVKGFYFHAQLSRFRGQLNAVVLRHKQSSLEGWVYAVQEDAHLKAEYADIEKAYKKWVMWTHPDVRARKMAAYPAEEKAKKSADLDEHYKQGDRVYKEVKGLYKDPGDLAYHIVHLLYALRVEERDKDQKDYRYYLMQSRRIQWGLVAETRGTDRVRMATELERGRREQAEERAAQAEDRAAEEQRGRAAAEDRAGQAEDRAAQSERARYEDKARTFRFVRQQGLSVAGAVQEVGGEEQVQYLVREQYLTAEEVTEGVEAEAGAGEVVRGSGLGDQRDRVVLGPSFTANMGAGEPDAAVAATREEGASPEPSALLGGP